MSSRTPGDGAPAGPDSIGVVSTLEAAYLSLLVVTAIVVTWFAVFVVYRLYRGQD